MSASNTDPTGFKKRPQRQYIRLDSVFPVQLRILGEDASSFVTDWIQGFTSNIGKAGICLALNAIPSDAVNLLKDGRAKLLLTIEIPLFSKAVSANASVSWFKDDPEGGDRYLVGLKYDLIDPGQNNRLMRYAWGRKLFFPAAMIMIVFLGAAFGINSYLNMRLVKGNKALAGQLVNILQESSIAKQQVKAILKERQDLQLKIQQLQSRISTLGGDLASQAPANSFQTQELNALIRELTQEKAAFQEQLINVQNKEHVVALDLSRLDKRRASLEKANLDNLILWIQRHQNPRTGLVLSYEGDAALCDWAFLYDQSLAIQVYVNFSDFDRAKKCLGFFAATAARSDGWFYNAYYGLDTNPAEFTIHSGPNIWLGIAILQYSGKSQDKSFVWLAEELAQKIIGLQAQDPDGGIPGGPGLSWFSTEHNLDAYAFFNMLYSFTSQEAYRQAADKILGWLVKHVYDKEGIAVLRGKGDSTIATDTYAWTIAAIGPEKLISMGMDPDMILDYAEKVCVVEVDWKAPGRDPVKIRGFDFAPGKHLARGGLVSSEWTAQMVLVYKLMAEFYYKQEMAAKARSYELKADNYLTALAAMVVSSPSPSGQGQSCLPYSTQGNTDTGHGWVTPKGEDTGSLSATALTIFAYYGYNPFELKK